MDQSFSLWGGASLELKVLRSFVILCEELHFGRAAQRLCIVQPALTTQIKALERELGVALFVRDRHRVSLSEAGRLFLPGARATLDQARLAVDRVRAAERGEVGRVRVGFISSVLPWYLPALMRRLRQSYPAIEMELKDMPTPEQVEALRAGGLDFGFVRLPVDDGELEMQPILEEDFVMAMPQDDPLVARASLVPADLQDRPCFVLARRFAPGFHDALCLAFASVGVSLRIDREFGEFTTMAALIGAGMGIGLVPRLALPTPPSGVVVRPIEIGGHRSRVGLAWTGLIAPVGRTFKALAIEVAAHSPDA